eukprot:4265110-Alexandrium_andersonii.AAC.1
MPRVGLRELVRRADEEADETPPVATPLEPCPLVTAALRDCFRGTASAASAQQWCLHASVSYTHLTLPTICSV